MRLRLAARLVLLFVFVAFVNARADRVDDLGEALANDPSFKVRVQAALGLGRLGDARGVPALIDALDDVNETVRGMAVQSLALIGDPRGLGPVRALRTDESPFVRDSVEKVLPAWEATTKRGRSDAPPPLPAPLVRTPLPPAPRGARWFLTTNLAVKGARPDSSARLTEGTLHAVGKLPKVAVTVPGARPNAAPPDGRRLAALKLTGLVIEGTLTVSLAKTPAQLDCAWSGVIATWPARAIRATLSATLAVPGARRLDQDNALGQCLDTVAGLIAEETRKYVVTK